MMEVGGYNLFELMVGHTRPAWTEPYDRAMRNALRDPHVHPWPLTGKGMDDEVYMAWLLEQQCEAGRIAMHGVGSEPPVSEGKQMTQSSVLPPVGVGVVGEHAMPQDDEVAMLEQMYGPMEVWNEEGVFNPGL